MLNELEEQLRTLEMWIALKEVECDTWNPWKRRRAKRDLECLREARGMVLRELKIHIGD